MLSYPQFTITSQCPPAPVEEIAELQQRQSTEPILFLIEKREKNGFRIMNMILTLSP
jgi:hypothetical protein